MTVQNQDSLLDALDSRIDDGELPRIEKRDNLDFLTIDVDSPEIHSMIPNKFRNFKEEPQSFLQDTESARNNRYD